MRAWDGRRGGGERENYQNALPADLLWTWDAEAKLENDLQGFLQLKFNAIVYRSRPCRLSLWAPPITCQPRRSRDAKSPHCARMDRARSHPSCVRHQRVTLHHPRWPASFTLRDDHGINIPSILVQHAGGWYISFVWKPLIAAYITTTWQPSCWVLETNDQFRSIIHRITSDLQQ